MLSKLLSRVYSSTTVQKHQFFRGTIFPRRIKLFYKQQAGDPGEGGGLSLGRSHRVMLSVRNKDVNKS